MLKMMGWKEGEGLGQREDSIIEPIKITNESINHEGLGSKAINRNNINREEANEIIMNYANSDAIEADGFALDETLICCCSECDTCDRCDIWFYQDTNIRLHIPL